MVGLKERHERALDLIAHKTLSKNELRLAARFNPNTVNEVLETLTELGLIKPLNGERGEGIHLTEKGSEIAASIILLKMQLA